MWRLLSNYDAKRLHRATANGTSLAFVRANGWALSTSVLNQAVSSGTNFVLGLFLVRALSTAEFGVFGLATAVCYLYAGLGNALFLTQMVVHTPDRPEQDRVPYTTRIFIAVVMFGATTILLVGVGAGVTRLLLPAAVGETAFALHVALASVSYLLKDYFVRQAYTARTESRALAVNGGVAAFLVASLAVLHGARVELNAERALQVFAGSQLAGAAAGLVLARLPLGSVRGSGVFEAIASSWSGGRWAIAGVVVTWAQSQAYAYVTALFAGTAGVGRANAARLLVAPFFFLVPAVNQVKMPRLADMRSRDRPGMFRTGTVLTIVVLAMGVLYAVLLLGTIDRVIPAVLGPKYSGMRVLVGAWCIAMLALLLRDGASILLQVLKHFRALTLMNVVSAIASIACVVALTPGFGPAGAVLGSAAGEIVLAALLWRIVRHERISVR